VGGIGTVILAAKRHSAWWHYFASSAITNSCGAIFDLFQCRPLLYNQWGTDMVNNMAKLT